MVVTWNILKHQPFLTLQQVLHLLRIHVCSLALIWYNDNLLLMQKLYLPLQ